MPTDENEPAPGEAAETTPEPASGPSAEPDDEAVAWEIEATDIEALAEEAGAFELGEFADESGDEQSGLVIECETPVIFNDPVYDLNGASQVYLSAVLASACPEISVIDVESVGESVIADGQALSIAIEQEENDYRITALRDFIDGDTVELAVFTVEGESRLIDLKNGIELEDKPAEADAHVPEIAEAAESEEAPEAVDVEESEEAPEAVDVQESEEAPEAVDVEETEEALQAVEATESEEVPEAVDAAESEEDGSADSDEPVTPEAVDTDAQAEPGRAIITANINVAALDAPYSLNRLLAQARGEAEDADAELLLTYDEGLFSIERTEDDHLITPLKDFESAVIRVEAADIYALNLLNGAGEEAVAYPAQSFEAHIDAMAVRVSAGEGAFPEGTTMAVSPVYDAATLGDIAGSVEDDGTAVKTVHAVDITFRNAGGEEIEPLIPISVQMNVETLENSDDAVVVHMDNEGNTEVVDQTASEPEVVAFDAETFSIYAVVVTERYISADGQTWNIQVRYDVNAGIPEGALLRVREIGGEAYQRYLEQAAGELSGRRIDSARFFDISIMDGAREIQPRAAVQVKIALEQGEGAVQAIHFGEAVELIDEVAQEGEALVFEAERFSVYGVVFTVDFEYQGKTFSLLGLEEIRLSALLEALEMDVAMDAVADVTFSSDWLVRVQRLTDDWLLTSLEPFASQERLTIALNDGTTIVIDVTDAQYTNNLADLFSSVEILKNGAAVDMDRPVIVREGDVFTLNMMFTEHDEFQFVNDDTLMYYQLPEPFQMPYDFHTATDVVIEVGGKKHTLKNNVITYDRDTHRITLQWNATDPEFDFLKQSGNAQVLVSLDGHFDVEENRIVQFSDTVSVEISTPADAGVQKEAVYDRDANVIHYALRVQAEGDVRQPIHLEDALSGQALSYLPETLDVRWGDAGKRPATEIETIVDQIKASSTMTAAGRGFGIDIPALYDGEVVVIRYDTRVDKSRLTLSAITAYDEAGNLIRQIFDDTGNTVTLTNPGNLYDEESNNVAMSVTPIDFSNMLKSVDLTPPANGQDAQGNEIRYRDAVWTIETNTDAQATLAGTEIADTLTYYPDFVKMTLQPLAGEGAGIHMRIYDQETGAEDNTLATRLVEERFVPWSKLHIRYAEGADPAGDRVNYVYWTYDVPETDDSYKYVITYTTRALIPDIKVGSTVYNDVRGRGGYAEANVTLWPGGDGDNIHVDKAVEKSSLESIVWNIDIYACKTEYQQYFRVTDILPFQWIDRSEGTGSDLMKDGVGGSLSPEWDGMTDEEKVAALKSALVITGITEDEKWEPELVKGNPYSADRLLIRFYKKLADTQTWVEGLHAYNEGEYLVERGGKTYRHISVWLTTDNNPEWVNRATERISTKAWLAAHRNKVQVRGDVGHYDFDETSVPIVKPTIIKKRNSDANWAEQYSPVKVTQPDGKQVDYPAYRFVVNVGGIRDDNYTLHTDEYGNPYIEILDEYDSSVEDAWRLYNQGSDWRNIRAYYADRSGYPSDGHAWPIGQAEDWPAGNMSGEWGNGRFVFRESANQLTLRIYYPPKKEDNSYQTFYTFLYWLWPRDAVAMDRIIAEALKPENQQTLAHMTKGVKEFTNTAQLRLTQGDPLKSADTYVYEYNPTSKSVVYDAENKIASYTIVLNGQKAKLLGSESGADALIEVRDTHSHNLVVDYQTIRITTEPAANKEKVKYDYSGDTGTFRIPDETAVTITYDARVNSRGGNAVNFSNTVTMNGFSSEVTYTQRISSQSSSTAGVYQLRLYKYAEGDMERGLAHARFRLLDANRKPITDRAGAVITFETGEDGYSTITLNESEQGVSLKKNTVYYLQEIKAPDQYKQDPLCYSFLITDNPDYAAPGGAYVFGNGDILKVRNYEDLGGINISKNFAGNVSLTEAQKKKITFRIEKYNEISRGWQLYKEIGYADFRYSDALRGDGEQITGSFHWEHALTPGAYRVVERNAEAPGATLAQEYMVDNETFDHVTTFTVTEEDLATRRSHNVIVTNTYFKPVYTITKIDAESGANLAGAVFDVYRYVADGDDVSLNKAYRTDDAGRLEIAFADGGYAKNTLYYAAEIAAPAGYRTPANPEKFFFYFSESGEKPAVPAGYAAVDLSRDYGDARVTNEKTRVSVPVKKTWGPGGVLNWLPTVKYVRVGLYQREAGAPEGQVTPAMKDGEPITLLLTEEQPEAAFEDLPGAADSGKALEYSVRELAISFDGETDADPEDTFIVTYDPENEPDPEHKIINNTDRGTSLSVTKKWYERRPDGTAELIENPTGEEYERLFIIYRTTEEKVIPSETDSIELISRGVGWTYSSEVQLISPGDTLEITIQNNVNSSRDFFLEYMSKSNYYQYNNFDYLDEGDIKFGKLTVPKYETRTFLFTVPTQVYKQHNANGVDETLVPIRTLALRYWGAETQNVANVRVKKARLGSTGSGQISQAVNHSATQDIQVVTAFNLSDAHGWTFESDTLEKYDAEGREYIYWVVESDGDENTKYYYNHGEVTVSNYRETTKFRVEKEWLTSAGEKITGKDGVVFDLYRTTNAIEGDTGSATGAKRVEIAYRNNNGSANASYLKNPDEIGSSNLPEYMYVSEGDELQYTFSEIEIYNGTNPNLIVGKRCINFNAQYHDGNTYVSFGQKGYFDKNNMDETVVSDIKNVTEEMLQYDKWYFVTWDNPLKLKIENLSSVITKEHEQLKAISEGAELVEADIVIPASGAWDNYTAGLALPKCDDNGNEYHYFAVEHPVAGYRPSYLIKDGQTTIRNTDMAESEDGALTLTKVIKAPVPAEAAAKQSFLFTVTQNGYYYREDGTHSTEPCYIRVTKQADGYSTATLSHLSEGEYTISELMQKSGEREGAEIPYYTLTSVVKVGGATCGGDRVTVTRGETTAAVIENTYAYGVEQTAITAQKRWYAPDGTTEVTGSALAGRSSTLMLRRYRGAEADYEWNPEEHLVALDGDIDSEDVDTVRGAEDAPWHASWSGIDRVYWDYDAEIYRDFTYVVEEIAAGADGVSSDLTDNRWLVDIAQDGVNWTVKNTPNTQRITLTKVWQNAAGAKADWPMDGAAHLPIELVMVRELEIPGQGVKTYDETTTFTLVPDDDRLRALNAATGCTVTCRKVNGDYVFQIDGLENRRAVTIGSKTFTGNWVYLFTEKATEGYAAPDYGQDESGTANSDAVNGGTITNRQQPVTAAIAVTKALTLGDGMTPADDAHWPTGGFEFTLTGGGMNETVTATRDAKTQTFPEITYNAPGTYTYTLTEVNSGAENITYDAGQHTVTVVVTEEKGRLAVEVKYDAGLNALTVVNKYTEPGAVMFKVKKTFVGGEFSEDRPFSFTLSDGEGVLQTITTEGQTGHDAVLSFAPVALTEGTHRFQIREVVPEETGDVQYDARQVDVTVVVNAAGNVTKNGAAYDMETAGVDAEFVNTRLTDLTAAKHWLCSDGVTPLEPEADTAVTLQLKRWKGDALEAVGEAVTLEAASGWTHIWPNQPVGYRQEDGTLHDYEYLVEETHVRYGGGAAQAVSDGMTEDGAFLVFADGMSVTNRQNLKRVEFGKQWKDCYGTPVEWPEGKTITVTLGRQGDDEFSRTYAIAPTVSTEGVRWTWDVNDPERLYWFSIENLPWYKSDGRTEWKYYIKEQPVADYITLYSAGENQASERASSADSREYIVNRPITTGIKVTKEWMDSSGSTITQWPVGKTITLEVNTSPATSVEVGMEEGKLTAKCGGALTVNVSERYPFTISVEGMPCLDSEGREYVYGITEATVPGYETSYVNVPADASAARHGGRIVNTRLHEPFTFSKVWLEAGAAFPASQFIPWPAGEIGLTVIRLRPGGAQDETFQLIYAVTAEADGGIAPGDDSRIGGQPLTDAERKAYALSRTVDAKNRYAFAIDGLIEEGYTYYVMESGIPEGYGTARYGDLDAEERVAFRQDYIGKVQSGGVIINQPSMAPEGFELPSTGGPGTALYTLTGMTLTLSALFLLFRKLLDLLKMGYRR